MLNRLSRLQLAIVTALGVVAAFGAFCTAVGALVLFNGWYDVSASKPHSRLTGWLLHTTMIHSVHARAGASLLPTSFSPVQVKEGFELYEAHCVMCHGGPGVARARWVNGINPSPPYVIDSARRWSPSELRFIVGNGVKMTAMPAWNQTLTPAQITSLVAFLEALPNMSTNDYRSLRSARRAQDIHAHSR